MIDIKDVEKKANYIIFNDVSDFNVDNIINKINKIIKTRKCNNKEFSNLFFLLGRLYIKKENYIKSKIYFNKAYEYDNSNKKALDMILKLSIFDKNYNDAKDQIKTIEKLNTLEKNKISIEIVQTLLNVLNNADDYLIYNKKITFNSQNSDNTVYDKIIKSIIDLNFNEAIKFIDNQYVKIYLKSQIKLLLSEINELKKEKELDRIKKINDRLFDEENYDEITNNLISIKERNNDVIKYIVACCKKIIESNDFDNAKKIILLLEKKYNNVNVNLLKRKLHSDVNRHNRNEERRNDIITIIENANAEMLYGNYNNALNYLLCGLEYTNENIFNYYIGKVYFKYFRDYDLAEKYLKQYEKTGFGKLSKCEFYLTRIAIKKDGKYNEYLKKYIEVETFLENNNSDFFDDNINFLERKILYSKAKTKNSFYNKYQAKYIDMSEDDFILGNKKI